MPRLSDEKLRDRHDDPHCPTNTRLVIAELIERRAADAPLAVGTRVTCRSHAGNLLFVGLDPRYQPNARTPMVILVGAGGPFGVALEAITPAQPTAAEVFADDLSSRIGAKNPLVTTTDAMDAFLEACRVLGIDPDAPLVTDSEVAS